jgi:amino acid transporter
MNHSCKKLIESLRSKGRVFSLYAVAFVGLSNVAGNSIVFAKSVLNACNEDSSDQLILALVTMSVVIFACVVHMLAARSGRLLNYIFAYVKVLIILLLIIAGIISAVKSRYSPTVISDQNMRSDAESSSILWRETTYKLLSSLLCVMFAYAGFNQANYVSISFPLTDTKTDL